MSAYGAVFLAVVTVSAIFSWADRGRGNLRGPVLAVEYAATELREADDRLQLPTDGKLADLAARNPAMWLIVLKNGRRVTMGAAPPSALDAVSRFQGIFDIVLVRLPGPDTPLAVAAVKVVDFGSGRLLIAAGGVDPVSLTAAESIDILLDPAVVAMLVAIAVIGLLAMLLAIPSFSRALRPITAEVGAIGPQDPSRRLREAEAPSELIPLVRGFNAALDRLEVELGRRRRFVADVAHELRTPLAAISLRVDSLHVAEGKEDLQRGLRSLTHLVAQMLDLERLSLLSDLGRSSVDLVSVVRDVVADLAPMTIDRGHDLSLRAPNAPVIVLGDPHAIARAVTNLISNAVEHGNDAGRVEVKVGADRTVMVADDGPGIAADLQPRLFDPFVRGSRNTGGCGLGLHIVREIMTRQNGSVSLVSSHTGTIFRLDFQEP